MHKQFAPSGPNYSPNFPAYTKEENDFLKANLNGMHDNNFMKTRGYPNTSGLKTVKRYSTCTFTLPPAENYGVCFTGLPEVPVLTYTLTGSEAGALHARVYNNMPIVSGSPAAMPSDQMKSDAIGAYRAVSSSYKIEDISAPLYRKGSIYTVNIPQVCDTIPIDVNSDVATLQYVQPIRVVNRLPTEERHITSASSNYKVRPMELGAYRPLAPMNPSNDFIPRDSPENKAVFSTAVSMGATGNINTNIQLRANLLGVKVGDNTSINLIQDVVNGASVETLDQSAYIPVSKPVTQGQMVFMSGLDSTNFSCRITVSTCFEYMLESNSPIADMVSPSMKTNYDLIAFANRVMADMPASYPASSNDFNDIWNRAKSIYNEWVSPIAKALLPALPPQAQAVVSGITSITDKIKKTTVAPKPKPASAALAKVFSAAKGSQGRRR